MTKERLEEIRKQKGTVYTVFDGDKEATALVLDEKCNDNNVLAQAYFCLSNLFETKEKAEWHNKTYTERTERFEPPMWEEIEDKFNYRFTVNNNCYKLVVYKTGNLIGIWNTTEKEEVYTALCEHCTKENYEKACEIVRDLFKGESNG